MKTFIIIEFLICFNIFDIIWTQTAINVGNTTQSGNQSIDLQTMQTPNTSIDSNPNLIDVSQENNTLNFRNLNDTHNENATTTTDIYNITETDKNINAEAVSPMNVTNNTTELPKQTLIQENQTALVNTSTLASNISETDYLIHNSTTNKLITMSPEDESSNSSILVNLTASTTTSTLNLDQIFEDRTTNQPLSVLNTMTTIEQNYTDIDSNSTSNSTNSTVGIESITTTNDTNTTTTGTENPINITITTVGNIENITSSENITTPLTVPILGNTNDSVINTTQSNLTTEPSTTTFEALNLTTIVNKTEETSTEISNLTTTTQTFLNSSPLIASITTSQTNEVSTQSTIPILNVSIPESTNASTIPTSTQTNISQTPEPLSATTTTTTTEKALSEPTLRTTISAKPQTTSYPNEPNISSITVTLPNIIPIHSIDKRDMVNIVTITFSAKTIYIFRWVSIFDVMFRNLTCTLIDAENNWCNIRRFYYVSPSPVVMNNLLVINFFVVDSTENDLNSYHVFPGRLIVEVMKNSTPIIEKTMGCKVVGVQASFGTIVVKPVETNNERLAKFELLVFIFTVVMFVCTVLLCLAIICSCAKRKSADMNQIELSNAGRRQIGTTNGGIDLNSASNILRDENHQKRPTNVINIDEGWVAPIDHVIENEKFSKYDNLQDTKL